MANGQEAEGPVGRIANRVMEVRELVHQIVVRKHHAFGCACSSRSIDDGSAFHFIDGGLSGCKFIFMRMVFAQLQQLVEIGVFLAVDHGIDQFHVGRIRQDVGHLVHHGKAVDDDHLGIAVSQDVTVILFADGRIHRHRDGSNLADSHIEHVPFGTVGQNHGHLVAFLDA